MNINCLQCGHSLDLRDAYDDYEGPVRCFICGSLLMIRTEDGRVKSVKATTSRQPEPCSHGQPE